MRPEKTRFFRRMTGALLLGFVVLFPLVRVSMTAAESRFRIGYSPQSLSCLPWSWYLEWMTPPKELQVGDIVVARTYKAFGGSPIGKLVIGLPGDHVKETGKGIWVNGHFWGRMWLLHWLRQTHRRVPKLPEDYVVPKDHVLLLGTNSQSLDGRYWGLVKDGNIHGSMSPI